LTTFTGTLADVAVAGHVPTAAELDTLHDALAAIVEPWTTYVPVWTTTGTAPVLGNGTLTGNYSQDGKMIICRGCLTLGSTSTVGTGTWIITTPVSAVDANQVGTAVVWDQSAGAARLSGTVVFNTTANFTVYIGTGGAVSNTIPAFAGGWGTGDKIIWQITYEAA